MNYLIGPSSNYLEERNGLGSWPKYSEQNQTACQLPKLLLSEPDKRGRRYLLEPAHVLTNAILLQSAHLSQKSECRSKCTRSGFAIVLTLQMTVVFSSPAANCARSSPACVLKPRVHRKPCNISCNCNAVSEAPSCWAPPLHALSLQRSQSPRQVQGAPGRGRRLRLPLHFVIPAACPGILLSAAERVGPV